MYHGRVPEASGRRRVRDKESNVMTVPVTVYSNVG
jgi:hypothetical protein